MILKIIKTFFLIFSLFMTSLSFAAEGVVLDNLKIIPRIKLTEKNSLKSYTWWENEKPKIPKIYKLILRKMRQDFLLEKFDIKFEIKKITKDNMPSFEGFYVLMGNLIVDIEDKKFHELLELSLYKVQNSELQLVLVSQTSALNLESSFRSMAMTLKEKQQVQKTTLSSSTVNYLNPGALNSYMVIFENELSFNDLELIKDKIQNLLQLPETDVSLHYSENKKYTYLLKSAQNPVVLLKDQVFVNGPYQMVTEDKTITFKPLSDGTSEADSSTDQNNKTSMESEPDEL